MMDAYPSLIVDYQRIADLSETMLLMAHQGEWDLLIDQEETYVSAVAGLAAQTHVLQTELTHEKQQVLAILLQKLIANEDTIKQLLQQRLAQLTGLINVSNRQQSLNTAYHKFSDSTSMLPGDLK